MEAKEMNIISEALMTNRDYDGEIVTVFEADAVDGSGNECIAVWNNIDWSKANGEDFSQCCDWDSPDELIAK